MGTAFLVMVGKFDVSQFTANNPILGPIIFSAYNCVILFFALNIFISIIIDSFEKVRNEAKVNPDKFGFLPHILDKIRKPFRAKNKKHDSDLVGQYKNHMNIFPSRVDVLISYFIKVYANKSFFWLLLENQS